MQGDGSTREAIRYLDELKIPNPGLDYSIKLDSHGHPEVVCYILPETRQALLLLVMPSSWIAKSDSSAL
jgi:hypothetical protein